MRKLALIALLALLCLGGVGYGAVFAQGTTPTPFCGDLSDADCAIMTQSQEAMRGLDSVTFDLDFNVNISNVPNMREPLAFNLTGSGGFSGLSALRDDMNQMMTTAMTDPSALIVSVLQNFNGELALTLNLPATAQQAGAPASITLETRLVDGVGYVNLDPLQPLLNQPTLQGWYGLDLAGLVSAVLQQMPDLFTQAMPNGFDPMQYAEQFQNPEFLSSFMSIERTDDGSGSVATFDLNFDFGALASSSAFQDMMRQQMQAQGTSLTEAEMGQAVAVSTQMLKGITMTIQEDISTDDNFVLSESGTMSFDLQGMMTAISAMTPGSKSTAGQPVPNIDVDFTLNFDNFNDAPVVTAPEDATVVPYQSLLGAMGNVMSQTAQQLSPTATAGSGG